MPHAGRRSRGPSELRTILEASVFAPSLSPFELSRIEHDMVERSVAGGGHVVSKGDPVEHWIVVVDGLVKVEGSAHDGRRTALIGVTRGGWFGEGSLLKGGRWPFDAVASTPTTVGLMPRSTFEWLLSSSIAFNRFLLDQINARLAQFVQRCEHCRFCDSGQHVAHCLAELWAQSIEPPPKRLRRLPLEGAEPGHERSGGPFVPGEEPGPQARRGLQGPPADRRSRIRGGLLGNTRFKRRRDARRSRRGAGVARRRVDVAAAVVARISGVHAQRA
jgi:CRP-like cAMP-binding protein